MSRVWAMGVSASGCAHDLSERAVAQAAAREALIQKIGEERGVGTTEVHAFVEGARWRMDLQSMNRTANFAEHGVAAPAVIRGENYQITEVERRGNGDQVLTAVRPIGGGHFETIKIRQCVEGGEYTRVTAATRGGRGA